MPPNTAPMITLTKISLLLASRTFSGLSPADHYAFGQMIRQAVEQTGRKAVLIASGDLSISESAYLAGFNNMSFFYKLYHRATKK